MAPCKPFFLTLPFAILTALVLPSIQAAELKKETLNAWDQYVKQEDLSLQKRAENGECFLWVDEDPARYKEARGGAVLVQPFGEDNPVHVSSGLIHHWIGAVFIPGATPGDVLSVTRDYAHYKENYKPGVADAKLINSTPDKDEFTIQFVNNSVLFKTLLLASYTTDFVHLSDTKWYSVSVTTQMQEIRDYGSENETRLPPGQGSGYIWRLYSSGRLEARDGGTILEIEAVALSREIPWSLRWFVDPIVRRVSHDSLEKSLSETKHAVQAHLQACAAQAAHSRFGPNQIAVSGSCTQNRDRLMRY